MTSHFSEGRATPDDIERGQGEHDVLLPKGPVESHHRAHPRTRTAERPKGRPPAPEDRTPNAETLLLKVTSTLASLHAGKMPSQEQIQRFLVFVLRSGALDVDSGDHPPDGVGWVRRGDGRSYPPSGMLAGTSASALGLEGTRQPSSASGIPGAKPKPKDPNALCDGLVLDLNDLAQKLLRFGMEKNDDDRIQELLWRLENAATVDGQAAATHAAMRQGQTLPMTTDIYTLISSFTTLLRTLSASSILRAALSDILDLLREFIAHTAHDVEQAASRIQHRAEEVEAKARESLEHGPPSVNEPIVEGIKTQAKAALSATKADVFQTADSLKKGVKDAREGSAQAGQDILVARLHRIITCICRDPAARLATKSIFTLLRKYASDITETLPHGSERTEEKTREAHPDAHTFILQDLKVLLERIGGGHSLSNLLNCFEHLMHDISDLPVKVGQDVAQDDAPASPDLDATPTPAHRQLPLSSQSSEEPPSPTTPSFTQSKKSRRKKKKTTLEQTLHAKSASASSLFALSASTSSQSEGTPNLDPLSIPDASAGLAHASPKVPSQPLGNPVADYFFRLGDFTERMLDDPGFISSRQGRGELEHLVNDGVSLLEAVEETVAEATTEEGFDSPTTPGGSSQDIKQRFRVDLHIFLTELHNYTDAIHKDPTTMGLVRSVCKLTDDFFAFLNDLPRLRRWSTWAAWLIPRFLRTSILPGLLPLIVPSLEFNSPSVDGKIWALFVKELVNMGDGGDELATPVAASLVPDTVVIREWTEVRINMAEGRASGGLGATDPSGSTVQSTSRLHLHADGLHGRVEDVGYWFRYFGACGLGYTDEGLLSVRIGNPEHKDHDGLGLDVEIEVDNADDDDEDDDDDGDGSSPVIAGRDGRRHRRVFTQPIVPKPLFKVNAVNVTASNVNVEISQSRHWILNKFFLQPVAGPILARSVQTSLEDRLRRALENLADLLGEVKTDVTRRRRASVARKEREAKATDAFGFRLTDAMWDWVGAFAQVLPSRFPGASPGPSSPPDNIHQEDSDADAESSFLARSVPTLVEDFGKPQEVEEDSVVVTVSAGISQDDPPIVRDTILEAANSPEPRKGLAVPVDVDVSNVRENVQVEWEERTVREQSGTWRSDAFDW